MVVTRRKVICLVSSEGERCPEGRIETIELIRKSRAHPRIRRLSALQTTVVEQHTELSIGHSTARQEPRQVLPGHSWPALQRHRIQQSRWWGTDPRADGAQPEQWHHRSIKELATRIRRLRGCHRKHHRIGSHECGSGQHGYSGKSGWSAGPSDQHASTRPCSVWTGYIWASDRQLWKE